MLHHEIKKELLADPAGDASEQGSSEPYSLSCMEVWGGNEPMESAVAVPGLVIHVYSRPFQGDAAGGDVLYVSTCGMGRVARILVADVAGHGQHVAELARTLRNLMRRFINYVDQTALMFLLNHEFAVAARAGRFATAIVATYWSATDCLTATNAGHPRPIWYCAATRRWAVLKDRELGEGEASPANLPLGVIDLAEYDQVMVRLATGDVVLFYTDSLTEACNSQGKMLGEKGLVDILNRLDATKSADLVHRIVEQVEMFRDGREAADDLTVVAMVCSGQKPRRSMTEKIDGMAQIGGAMIARLFGKRVPVPIPEMSVVSVLGVFIRPINRLWGGCLRSGEIRTGESARRGDRIKAQEPE